MTKLYLQTLAENQRRAVAVVAVAVASVNAFGKSLNASGYNNRDCEKDDSGKKISKESLLLT